MAQQNSPALREALTDDETEQVSGGRSGYRGAVFMYTVQTGETISVLAHRFGTTVRMLRDLNGIADAAQVKPGITLMIPQR